jgi:hypothetical protein
MPFSRGEKGISNLPSRSLIPALLPSGEGRLDPSSLHSGEREGVRGWRGKG